MTHDEIKFSLANDPGISLLRSDNAPLVISFLFEQFKRRPRAVIPHSELLESLERFLEPLRSRDAQRYPAKAQVYLSTWCNEGHQYLRKYYVSGSDDPVYELTPALERVIQWIQDLHRTEFVGTESRFLQIFGLLEEIARKSTQNPEERLAELERQKAALETEMGEVRQTGRVERYNTTQIKERFLKASEETRRLLADFREVEANFREVTRRVQERRLLEDATKGDIVGYVIDADDTLKESDQGRSFYAFWRFLIAHEKKQELRALLEKVYTLPEVASLGGDYSLLRNIIRHLSDAGEKIVQSNRILAEQLRRMLDETGLRENRRVAELIGEVKKAALEARDEPPAERAFTTIEGTPDLNLPMERPLWQPSETPNFTNQALEPDDLNLRDIDLTGLFDLFGVEREQLEQRIRRVLEDQPQITLAELVDLYPIERGLEEVLVYLSIAADDARYLIDEGRTDHIPVFGRTRLTRQISMPRVIFSR